MDILVSSDQLAMENMVFAEQSFHVARNCIWLSYYAIKSI